MADAIVSVNGAPCGAAVLRIPERGVWIAEAEYLDEGVGAGTVTLAFGDLEGVGTVVAVRSGTFSLRQSVSVVGGAAGWRRKLKARHYHNDALVKASHVIEAAASELGETVEGAPTTRLAADYTRAVSTGASLLSAIDPSWRVDLDGVTRFGARPPREAGGDYDLLSYDPRWRGGEIGLDPAAVSRIGIGTILRDARLPNPVKVRGLVLEAIGDRVRLRF